MSAIPAKAGIHPPKTDFLYQERLPISPRPYNPIMREFWNFLLADSEL